VQVHPETAFLLNLAQKCALYTNGAFDITLRPLAALWSVGKRGSFLPLESQVREALRLKGIDDLIINPEAGSAFLTRPGMAVDLGGITKGYAGDEVRRILAEQGISDALVNLGGNIIALGNNPEGRSWKIGIQNPLLGRGESLAVLDVRDKSVVTSGAGERFFIKDGKRYHHILDPKTGMPAQSGLLSATVVSPYGAVADALATAFFILGPVDSQSLIRRDHKGFFSKNSVAALFVAEDLHLSATPGLLASPVASKEVL